MSSKVRADCVELVNGLLDGIPLASEEDRRVVISALRELRASPDQPSPLPLEGRVEVIESVGSVKDLLDEPGIYARPEHTKEFRDVVLSRISSKIHELELFRPEDIRKTRVRQKREREEADECRRRVSRATPPEEGSEAHVVSEQEALRIHYRDGDPDPLLRGFLHNRGTPQANRSWMDGIVHAGLNLSLPDSLEVFDPELRIGPELRNILFAGEALRSDPEVVRLALRQGGLR